MSRPLKPEGPSLSRLRSEATVPLAKVAWCNQRNPRITPPKQLLGLCTLKLRGFIMRSPTLRESSFLISPRSPRSPRTPDSEQE